MYLAVHRHTATLTPWVCSNTRTTPVRLNFTAESTDILLSGDHAKIEKWRREQALLRTFKKRPDMLEKAELTKKDLKFIESLKLEEKSEQ